MNMSFAIADQLCEVYLVFLGSVNDQFRCSIEHETLNIKLTVGQASRGTYVSNTVGC